ncbi:hypothetical protein ACFVZD_36935 [Streptomyces sp. NPDC058287]|uniref:hypothetical protein n=1 Tax=Streptomyces sp. NPDC058287 TaxID=3346423 RepID=UPI0036E83DD4
MHVIAQAMRDCFTTTDPVSGETVNLADALWALQLQLGRCLGAPDGLGPHGERPSIVEGLYRISMALEELDLGSGYGGADD